MNRPIINKTMDWEDLLTDEARVVIGELNELILNLQARNLPVSSWYGNFNLSQSPFSLNWLNRGYGYKALDGAVDDTNFPWFLYWEIVWLVINNDFRPGHKALDLGGSSSLFSYYLASKGLDVTTVDLNSALVANANFVASQMGWRLRNCVMDMRSLSFDERFNHITSVCVYEHIPFSDRVAINQEIKGLLVDGGKFSITFDYRNPSRFARISSPEDVHKQFVEPSGLTIRGNTVFYDSGENYLLHPFYHRRGLLSIRHWMHRLWWVARGEIGTRPWEIVRTKKLNDYTFGALFLARS